MRERDNVSATSGNDARTIDTDGTRESLISVRRLERGDRAQWHFLWRQYLGPTAGARVPGFYLQPPPEQVVDGTFERLVDPERQPYALVAVSADRLVGFAHYVFHPSTWSSTQVCYLEDLYVEPTMRRLGAGRALMRALYAAADEANAAAVYWVTHGSNTASQGFFETFARRTAFIRYER
jgi:GNAT superfamily N-acetyltransferase